MFARNKDLLVLHSICDDLENEISLLEDTARMNHNELVDTCDKNIELTELGFKGINTIVEDLRVNIEDLRVDANELDEKFDVLCDHLGVSIEYKGEQRTYDVTTTVTSNN